MEITLTSSGGAQVTERLYFDVCEDHLPVLAGFTALSGFDRASMTAFLQARLEGLDRLIVDGKLSDEERSFLYTGKRIVAAD